MEIVGGLRLEVIAFGGWRLEVRGWRKKFV
jgi:hypothetical protein